MSAPVVALLSRGLRLDSRLGMLHILRTCLLIALAVAVSLFASPGTNRGIGAPGLVFLSQLVGITIFFLCVVAVTSFATLITDEKEENMLGLLQMAGLTPFAILLGKAGSSGVAAMIFLLSQVPFTLIAVTLGGVSTHQLLALYCSLFAFTIFLLGAGLLCSVVALHGRRSMFATGVLLGLVFVLLPMFGPTKDFSILTRVGQILKSGFVGNVIDFQVVSNTAAGVLFFGIAWAVFERATSSLASAGLLFGERLPILRPGRASQFAIFWKDFNFLGGGSRMTMVKLVASGVVLIAFVKVSGFPRIIRPASTTLMGWLGICGALAVAFMIDLTLGASRMFAEEVRERTLSALMTLPLTSSQIFWQKARAAVLPSWPLAFVLLAAIMIRPPDIGALFLAPLVCVPALVLYVYVVCYFSLVVKRLSIPVAIGVWLMLFVASLYATGFGPVEWMFVGFVFFRSFNIFVSMAFHRAILRRVEALAAE